MRKGFERQETHPVRKRRSSKVRINVCEDDLVKQSTQSTKQPKPGNGGKYAQICVSTEKSRYLCMFVTRKQQNTHSINGKAIQKNHRDIGASVCQRSRSHRSSGRCICTRGYLCTLSAPEERRRVVHRRIGRARRDRKSTRLNSSHANISYAVFCLKNKKIRDMI